jgi:DNA-binding NarL/FixJ family response regulator
VKDSIQVIVVDDHTVVRRGVVSLLKENDRIEIVAQGSAGNHVLELVELHRPDVLIADLQMPAQESDPTGPMFEPIYTLQKVIKKFPETAVIVLTQSDDIQTMQSLAEIGVKGYILKSDDFTQFLGRAVEMIHAGGMYLSPEVREVVIAAPLSKLKKPLTGRPLTVLKTIVGSPEASRDEIADMLSISKYTVDKHITTINSAFNVSSLEASILKAIRAGIIHIEDIGD